MNPTINSHSINIRRYATRAVDAKKTVVVAKPATITTIHERASSALSYPPGWDLNKLDDANAWGDLSAVDPYPDQTPQLPPSRTDTSYRSKQFYSELLDATGTKPKTDNGSELFWIVPDVLALGGRPDGEQVRDLKDVGIKAIVSVGKKQLAHPTGYTYFFIPTSEGKTGSLLEICRFIDQMERRKNPVFVHSTHGPGRAATVCAAYFVFKKWLKSPQEAIDYMRLKYNHKAITTDQQVGLVEFANELARDKQARLN